MGIRGASAHYDASAEFMGITVNNENNYKLEADELSKVRAGVTADISDIQIFLDAEMVLTGGSGLQLTDFKVSRIFVYF